MLKVLPDSQLSLGYAVEVGVTQINYSNNLNQNNKTY